LHEEIEVHWRANRARISYNDPAWPAARHNLPEKATEAIVATRELLAAIVNDAI